MSNRLTECDTTDVKIKNFLQKSIGSVKEIRSVPGGIVHRVFRVLSDTGEYYLKVRGNNFVGIKSISTIPSDICYEASALKICSKISPETFPHVVAESFEDGMILITSIMEKEEYFLSIIERNVLDECCFKNIGSKLRHIHNELSFYTNGLRNDGDKDRYIRNLVNRLGYQKHNVLDDVIKDLSKEKRFLILGDLSPKNLGISSGHIRICDLDTAHCGNSIFDVGYFMGHVYLHGFEQKYTSSKYVEEFFQGYQAGDFGSVYIKNELLLKRIILGTILYRLNNDIIPYLIRLTSKQKIDAVSKINKLLSSEDISWKAIENIIYF